MIYQVDSVEKTTDIIKLKGWYEWVSNFLSNVKGSLLAKVFF